MQSGCIIFMNKRTFGELLFSKLKDTNPADVHTIRAYQKDQEAPKANGTSPSFSQGTTNFATNELRMIEDGVKNLLTDKNQLTI
jgi:hypothetical protein